MQNIHLLKFSYHILFFCNMPDLEKLFSYMYKVYLAKNQTYYLPIYILKKKRQRISSFYFHFQFAILRLSKKCIIYKLKKRFYFHIMISVLYVLLYCIILIQVLIIDLGKVQKLGCRAFNISCTDFLKIFDQKHLNIKYFCFTCDKIAKTFNEYEKENCQCN